MRNRQYLKLTRLASLAALIACCLTIAPVRAKAQSDRDSEYRVKLAFLYNFTQFIQWPPEAFTSATAPLVLCVAGEDPFKGEIEQSLHGRTAQGHPIELKQLKPGEDPRSCHAVFVRSTEKKMAARVLSELKGSNTLTVGESSGFAAQGGLVNLILDENKLRFEINLEASMQTHLKMSSKLLSLAKIVQVQQHP